MPNMAPTYDQFSAFLLTRMSELNLSQNRLAELAKISPDTINRMTRGKGPFGTQTLEKVAPHLGVEADYLKHLVGIVERRNAIIEDPEVIEVALQIEELSPARRHQVLQVVRAVLGLFKGIGNATGFEAPEYTTGQISETITEGYDVMSNRERLAEWVRSFREQDPEEFQEFLKLLGDDDSTPTGAHT